MADGLPTARWNPEGSEVYVQGFTLDSSQPRGKWQVSAAGGEIPRWRRDGKELFYASADGYFAVDVKTDGRILRSRYPQTPVRYCRVSNRTVTGGQQPFVVTSDGQRFLVLAPAEKTVSAPLEVLVNWR